MRTHFIVPVLVISALAACGGGHKNQNTNTYSAAPGNAAAPGNTVAQVPANLHCGAVSPVWANTRTHVYHVSSDPMYGRTKHGEYMCPQEAVRQGYHEAGGRGSTYGAKRERRRHHGGMMAQPSPSPAST